MKSQQLGSGVPYRGCTRPFPVERRRRRTPPSHDRHPPHAGTQAKRTLRLRDVLEKLSPLQEMRRAWGNRGVLVQLGPEELRELFSGRMRRFVRFDSSLRFPCRLHGVLRIGTLKRYSATDFIKTSKRDDGVGVVFNCVHNVNNPVRFIHRFISR